MTNQRQKSVLESKQKAKRWAVREITSKWFMGYSEGTFSDDICYAYLFEKKEEAEKKCQVYGHHEVVEVNVTIESQIFIDRWKKIETEKKTTS